VNRLQSRVDFLCGGFVAVDVGGDELRHFMR
jgi:hypothetical protein